MEDQEFYHWYASNKTLIEASLKVCRGEEQTLEMMEVILKNAFLGGALAQAKSNLKKLQS